MSEAASETKATTEEQLAALAAAQKELADKLAALDRTDPETTEGKKAERAVEAAETKVETAAERVGLTEEAIDAICDKVAERIERWADEAEEAEKAARETEKEQGELGKLAAGTEPVAPPETASTTGSAEDPASAGSGTPPPAEPEQPPEKVHWSQRKLGRSE